MVPLKRLGTLRPASSRGGGPYEDPSVYDILTGHGTAREVDALLLLAARWIRTGAARSRRSDRRHPVWLEPACGTGRYLRVLAARGHRVLGFDRSPRLVEYANARLRARGLRRRASACVADMTQFAATIGRSRVEFAFNLHNTLRHLASDEAVLAHLEEMSRVLRPGGIYAVGISLTRYGNDPVEEDVWVGRRGRCTVRQIVQYLPPGSPGHDPERPRFERVVSHVAIERPSGVEHRDSVYDLRCYDARQWERLVARSALRRMATVDWWGTTLASRAAPYAIDLLAP